MKITSLNVWTPFSRTPEFNQAIHANIPFHGTVRASLRSYFLTLPDVTLAKNPSITRFKDIAEYLVAIPGFDKPQMLFVQKVRA